MDLLEKTHGAAGCGHCQTLGAEQTCPVCGRPVCAGCHDRQTCPEKPPEPVFRELGLGAGARLRHVDHHGRYGLVTTWTGRRKLVDLTTGETVARKLPVSFREAHPRLVAGKRLAHLAWSSLNPMVEDGLRLLGLDGQGERAIRTRRYEHFKALEVSEDGTLLALVRGDETVAVFDVGRRERSGVYQVRGRVVHAVAICAASRLVALGTFGRVSFFDLDDHNALGTCSLADDGDVRWIGLGRKRLAAITEHGRCTAVEIDRGSPPSRWQPHPRKLRLTTKVPASFLPRLTDDILDVAAVDDAGDLLALPADRDVMLHRLSTGRATPLSGHTDDISLLRFVDGGRLLVSADDDARVRLWPLVDGEPVLNQRT